MVGSLVIFALIFLFFVAMPVFNFNRDWGYKPAAIVGVLLVVAGILKWTGVI